MSRKNIDIKCTSDELQSLQIINNRISCANQMLMPDALPANVKDQEQINMFVKAAINAKADSQYLSSVWWVDMIAKYSLPKGKNVFIDFGTGDFYLNESD